MRLRYTERAEGIDYIIAASNAATRIQNRADYVCDGVGDEVEINAAINLLPVGGGRVLLTGGTFSIANPISMKSYCCLEGLGRGTKIQLAASTNKNVISGSNIVEASIGNLYVDGNKANNTTQSDETIQNGIFMDQWYDSHLYNVWSWNNINAGIRIQPVSGTSSAKVLKTNFVNISTKLNAGNGIEVDTWAEYMNFTNVMSGTNKGNGVQIETANLNFNGCQFILNSGNGVYLNVSDKTTNNTINGCKINHNALNGVYLNQVDGGQVNNCDIIANVYNGVYVHGSTQWKINGNTINTNSYGNLGTYDSVLLDDSSYNNVISFNTMIRSSGGANYGINELSGSNNIYIGNIMYGHETAEMSAVDETSINQHNIT